MKSRLLGLAEDLRQSYWFLPSLMAVAAALLAGGMIWIDDHWTAAWMDRLPWLYASRPDGARQVLSDIGGSMITVAGTVFSVTIAAVVYASGQYGPRLLSNFMRDRGNQVTLGTFIATFLYCLLVLRTIRSPEEDGGGASGFVPNLALLVAVVLAVCSVAVLIFFIHHVPSRIHINSVIEDIGVRLLRELRRRFPEFIGAGAPADAEREDLKTALDAPLHVSPDRAATVRAEGSGYIQVIDEDQLLHSAARHDLVCRLRYRPGDFVHAGRPLADLWPADRAGDGAQHAVREAFALGSRRTALQDLRFLIDELVEIAARALSPGVNDPFTAVTCLDWLGAAMSDLGRRDAPSPLRRDDQGEVRVIALPDTFGYFLDRSFGALAQHCASELVAALRFLETLGEVAAGCEQADRLEAVAELAGKMSLMAPQALREPDGGRVAAKGAELRRSILARAAGEAAKPAAAAS